MSQSEEKKYKKKTQEIINDEHYTTITIAVIGSVDSGKSTTVGVLTSGNLDKGNGEARFNIFKHPHERSSGRSSSINYHYYKNETEKRIYNFIDLAGHAQYLKTTINGLVSGFPDLAIVCISDKITPMTRQHLGLAITMEIPVLILFTKIDIVPIDKIKTIHQQLNTILKSVRKKLYKIKTVEDINFICSVDQNNQNNPIIPFVEISNVTGAGIDTTKLILSLCTKKIYKIPNAFVIDAIFNVVGHGSVVSGVTGGKDINPNDILYLGPLGKGEFIEVKVKSIHNDYHFQINKLQTGKRGCLCIKINFKKKLLRPGLVLHHEKPPNVCKKFKAFVKIHHHATTIKDGYEVFANCGMIREPVKFIKIMDVKLTDRVRDKIQDKTQDKMQSNLLRSGSEADVIIEFVNLNYIEIGQKIYFRDGTTKGVGIINCMIDD